MKNTEHDLNTKTVSAVTWSVLDIAGRQVVRLCITIFLARILAPQEFGFIAMLSIFIALAASFVDCGFAAAIIQRRGLTQNEKSSVFYFNVFLAVTMAGILYICSPFIAAFYSVPLLTPLTRLLSLNLVISSFGSVHVALLTKQLDFHTQVKAGFVGTIISGIVAVVLAYRGAGVWSLAVQTIVATLVSTSLLWLLSSWRPSLVFSFSSLRPLFRFGSRLFLSGLLNTFFDRLYLVVIGKVFSPSILGYYSHAEKTKSMPANVVSSIVNRVTYPVFSHISNDKAILKRGMRKAIISITMLHFPLMFGLIVVARPLILTLFTDKWEPCVPYLQILGFGGLFLPLHIINLNALNALGRSDLFLRVELAKKVLIVVVLLITFRISVMAMIWGKVVISAIAYGLNAYYTRLLVDYPIREQIRDFAPCLVAAVVMALSAWLIKFILFASPAFCLIIQFLAGFCVYVAICSGLRFPAFQAASSLIRAKISEALTNVSSFESNG